MSLPWMRDGWITPCCDTSETSLLKAWLFRPPHGLIDLDAFGGARPEPYLVVRNRGIGCTGRRERPGNRSLARSIAVHSCLEYDNYFKYLRPEHSSMLCTDAP